MKLQKFGEQALLVNFEQKIDESINEQVHALSDVVKNISGVTSTIPAYCSLTVMFDKSLIDFNSLSDQILSVDLSNIIKKKSRLITIPVCYAEPFALDIEELEKQLALDKNKIIDLHHSQAYKVYMMGFLPGFGYLGKLPNQLNCSRKSNPRKQVPAQSVGIAGLQTGIYPIAAPGGWQIIARTPIPIIDKDYENGFLLKAGDRVKFNAITVDEFEALNSLVEKRKFNYTQLYE